VSRPGIAIPVLNRTFLPISGNQRILDARRQYNKISARYRYSGLAYRLPPVFLLQMPGFFASPYFSLQITVLCKEAFFIGFYSPYGLPIKERWLQPKGAGWHNKH